MKSLISKINEFIRLIFLNIITFYTAPIEGDEIYDLSKV